MNHGNYYEDDDDDADINNLPPTGAGAGRGGGGGGNQPYGAYPGGFGGPGAGRGAGGAMGGILGQMMGGGGFGGMMGGGRYAQAPPSAFDEYYKAYSVAMMAGKERLNLSYGGKIIMPSSALAHLTQLDLPGPWNFILRNPKNPTLLKTHAGVLEFIAPEGHVYMPAWMMKTLQLSEGDPIRLTGASFPKGKFVKLQAQHPDFVEVSDAKAVLESALRNYSVLTKGDIIEIQYNSLTFEFLIQEIKPEGPGINLLDTDLEVDFDRPKGYKTPPRPAPIVLPTMADKLKIDLNSTTAASASSTRPSSVASVRPDPGVPGASGSDGFESFKGAGATLNGRKTKGKGKAKQIEEVDKFSKIQRTDKPRVVTNDSIANDGRLVPAPLILPPNQIFVGYKYIPFDPKKVVKKENKSGEEENAQPKSTFVGSGTTLSGRPSASTSRSSAPALKAEEADVKPPVDHWAGLSGGTSLAAAGSTTRTTGSASAPIEVDMDDDEMFEEEEYDWGAGDEEEDDDAIIVDSD